ncbi:O-antigen ligase [Lewinella marina]|uniref:O-antigen polymerase n=1 Tax=Neolewinella marina TaxID=438751 RepID=A0A2G0CH62_9BACT|nr:O-antigen ligase family protein [Neolewinella marina]NJB86271.1 O-antigen ligase [Neolewinella marina]PHK99257.1 O-antigen polymerase [Neolewinella marina]
MNRRLYTGYAAVVVLSIALAAGSGHYWLAGLPLLLWICIQAAVDIRPFFGLLLVMIPLGTEIQLPGGMGTDLPTEPIAVGLTGWLLLHAARHWPEYDHRTFLHPIALLLYLHVAWILVASGFGELKLISLKFSLAKLWYVGAFFLLPLLLLRTPRAVTLFAHCVFWPLLFVAVQTLVRHAGYGFSFADQFRTMSPFMRNHVSYAGCLATFSPWLGYLIWYRRREGKTYRWMVYLLLPLWVAAIFFSYTRAAYIALFLAGMGFLLIRRHLLRPAVTLAFVAAAAVAVYFVYDNNYLEYAPNYDTTIAHQEFDNLISATYKLEDISTMERFYRWVAGGNMVPYRPWTGFGPGSFVELYQAYTNNNFQTYVSDNEDRSGIHNYFLMTLVEQGYPGLLFLLAFLIGIFYYGQSLYARQSDPAARAAVVASLLSVTIVAAFSIINDLLETDKVGSLFFISTAILITMGKFRRPATLPPVTTGTPPQRY